MGVSGIDATGNDLPIVAYRGRVGYIIEPDEHDLKATSQSLKSFGTLTPSTIPCTISANALDGDKYYFRHQRGLMRLKECIIEFVNFPIDVSAPGSLRPISYTSNADSDGSIAKGHQLTIERTADW